MRERPPNSRRALQSHAAVPAFTAESTRAATSSGFSWVQARITVHPSPSRSTVFRASRSRFSSIFGSQYCRFVSGVVPCCGQPCQKQPSMKTATRCLGKTTSGRIGRRPGTAIGRSTRNRRPLAWRSDRTRRSGVVSRRRLERMIRRRASGTPAHPSSAPGGMRGFGRE